MNTTESEHVRRTWTVEVSIDAGRVLARAKARLRWCDREIVGVGTSGLDRADRRVSDIGDEFAAARAVSDLGSRLLGASAKDIEALTPRPARLAR